MLDVWLRGAYRDPGRNAGYNSGRSQMRRAVAHYTVGADSRNVGRNGFFHFLVHQDASRENGCTQYAEVDAVTWHAADAGNPYGPGVEWERRVTGGLNDEGLSDAEPLTPNQLEWGARLIPFFAEWGIPAQLYSGPRYHHAAWNGWINHQAIDSQRSDGLLRSEWDAMTGHQEEDDDVKPLYIGKKSDPKAGIWVTTGEWKRHVNADEWAFVQFVSPGTQVFQLTDQWWDSLPDATKVATKP